MLCGGSGGLGALTSNDGFVERMGRCGNGRKRESIESYFNQPSFHTFCIDRAVVVTIYDVQACHVTSSLLER